MDDFLTKMYRHEKKTKGDFAATLRVLTEGVAQNRRAWSVGRYFVLPLEDFLDKMAKSSNISDLLLPALRLEIALCASAEFLAQQGKAPQRDYADIEEAIACLSAGLLGIGNTEALMQELSEAFVSFVGGEESCVLRVAEEPVLHVPMEQNNEQNNEENNEENKKKKE